jgi:steroid delta-isomerase-like uncharacterized protein
MSTNLDLVRRFFTALDANDGDTLASLVTQDWVNDDPAMPPLSGPDGARALAATLTGAFPDFESRILLTVEDADHVAVHVRHTGTHHGDFMGVPATGRAAAVTSTGILTIRDGRIAENRVVFDALGLLTQLGVIPAPEPTTTA